jgi:hypothetical protein
MATYKVIQDIEAEDKLIWNLSFRQFVYGLIAAIFIYLSYIMIAHKVWFLLLLTVPVALFFGFLAFPFMKDQPTEVWALAKLRFLFKTQKRIWSQDGFVNLVTITAPKKFDQNLTKGLSQNEVQSRLETLANTLDSRGWAIKNITSNKIPTYSFAGSGDRLINIDTLNDQTRESEVHDFEDILDASNPDYRKFQDLVNQNTANKRQRLLDSLDNNAVQPENTTPTPIIKNTLDTSNAEMVNMRTLRTPQTVNNNNVAPQLNNPDIINASLDNLKSVSTISKEVNNSLNPVRETTSSDGEVVVSLR